MADSANMKELLTYLAQALVDHPERVQLAVIVDEQADIYELRVAKEDLGKVIGKQGRTARALRALLNAASMKQRKRAILKIQE